MIGAAREARLEAGVAMTVAALFDLRAAAAPPALTGELLSTMEQAGNAVRCDVPSSAKASEWAGGGEPNAIPSQELSALSKALYDEMDNLPNRWGEPEPQFKKAVLKDLDSRMKAAEPGLFKGVTADARRQAIRDLIDNWAGTSGDSDARAVALQLVAREEFGLSSSTTAHFSAETLEAAGKFLDSPFSKSGSQRELMGAFLRAQHEATQAWFSARGIEYVSLVRGARYAEVIEGLGSVRLQPLSSFSSSLTVADQFSGVHTVGSTERAIHIIRIPVSRVLSSPITGLGCWGESEFVILGGDYQSWTAKIYHDAEKALEGQWWRP